VASTLDSNQAWLGVEPGLRLLAEEMWFVIPPPPNANRVVTDSYVLQAPESGSVPFTSAGRLRVDENGVDDLVAEVRARMAAHGRDFVTWWVSPGAEPAGLAEGLREHGAVPFAEPSAEPRYAAMVLRDEPGAAPAGVVVRQVQDLDEYRLAMAIDWESFGAAPELRETWAAGLPEHYETRHLSGDAVAYLAFVDGEPAASAFASFRREGTALSGASTAVARRGRGAYRALVRARYEDAVAVGAPGLVVQAGAMSRPILERCGFESLGDVELLFDAFAR